MQREKGSTTSGNARVSFAIEAENMVERIFVLAYTAEPSRDTRIGGVIDLDQLSQICDL